MPAANTYVFGWPRRSGAANSTWSATRTTHAAKLNLCLTFTLPASKRCDRILTPKLTGRAGCLRVRKMAPEALSGHSVQLF
jgi:hypothetical protein